MAETGEKLADTIPVGAMVGGVAGVGDEAFVEGVEVGGGDGIGLTESKKDEKDRYGEGWGLDPLQGKVF